MKHCLQTWDHHDEYDVCRDGKTCVTTVLITAMNSAFVSGFYTLLIWAVACNTAVFYILSHGFVVVVPPIHFHCNTHFIISFRTRRNCSVPVAVFPRRFNITCIAVQACFCVCVYRQREKIIVFPVWIFTDSFRK